MMAAPTPTPAAAPTVAGSGGAGGGAGAGAGAGTAPTTTSSSSNTHDWRKTAPAALAAFATSMTEDEVTVAQQLVAAGQEHVFQAWSTAASKYTDKKHAFFAQVAAVGKVYPGGVSAYVTKARELLQASKRGANPLAGYKPTVPVTIDFSSSTSSAAAEAEAIALPVLQDCAFVLVAGGLGERLGYKGIKVSLPVETTTHKCYLGFYIEHILALQELSSAAAGDTSSSVRRIPLAIMTSHDTHDATVALLKDNDNFGMATDQITLVRQEQVPALEDDCGRIAMRADDCYQMQTKPHGHGDVHSLLHSSGVAKRWSDEKRRYVIFFQDTNGLCSTTIPAAIGASIQHKLAFNTICTARKAGDQTGSIVRLVSDSRTITANVEYNQLHPLLVASGSAVGDVNDPKTGLSPFPGNTNQLVISMDEYGALLDTTGGLMPEFVNPKYSDDSRTAFSKPVRLECMMQDVPKLLPAKAAVGATVMPAGDYSPVKNHISAAPGKLKKGVPPRTAGQGEFLQYDSACRRLRALGVSLPAATDMVVAGIPVPCTAFVVLDAHINATRASLAAAFPAPDKVTIAKGATLIVRGKSVVVRQLELRGALCIQVDDGVTAEVVVGEENEGWTVEHVEPEACSDAITAMRGFRFRRPVLRLLHYTAAGVEATTLRGAEVAEYLNT